MVKNSLNVSTLSEGFVLDPIQAGRSMEIYKHLNLDKLDCCVAIIKNAIDKYSLYGNRPAEIVLTAYGLMEIKDLSEVYEIDEKGGMEHE